MSLREMGFRNSQVESRNDPFACFGGREGEALGRYVFSLQSRADDLCHLSPAGNLTLRTRPSGNDISASPSSTWGRATLAAHSISAPLGPGEK